VPTASPVVVALRALMVLMAALACGLPYGAGAHDLPNDVKVQMFVRPSGDRLRLLVRVPLAAMREVDVPQRGPGYLDLARADSALRNAANLWIADNVEIYEGETRLAQPQLLDARITLPSDKSFVSYEEALAHLRGPRVPNSMDLFWNQQLLDVLFEYPIRSERSDFSIHPRLARLGLQVERVDLRVAEVHAARVPGNTLGDDAVAHAEPVEDLQRALGEADRA